MEARRDGMPAEQEGSDLNLPAAAASVVSKVHGASGDADHRGDRGVIGRGVHAEDLSVTGDYEVAALKIRVVVERA
jgi:hypothetical protein